MTSDQDARPQHDGEAPPLPPPPGTRYPVRHRRRLPWLVAILVVLVLAAAVTTTLLIRANRNQTSKPPVSSSSQQAPSGSASVSTAGPTTSAPASTAAPSGSVSPAPVTPPLLARGKEAAGSAIPWSQVNAGWHVSLWTPVTDSARMRSVPLTMFLVNPIGGRYRIATLPSDSSVELWSPDRQHAMIGRHMGSDRSRGLSEWDLRSGRQLSSIDLGSGGQFGYADPAGQSIALFVPGTGDQPGRLARFTLSGRHLQDFPPAGSAVGEFLGNVLPSADGQLLVVEARYGLAVLRSRDAAIVGQVVRPAGDQQCLLRRWWTSRSVLAYCSLLNGARNLYSIPVDGRPATAITHAVAPDPGFLDAWPISGGTLLQRAGLCGPGGQAVLAGGTVRSLSYRTPPGVDGSPSVAAVFADRASMYAGECGSDRGSLFSLNLRTGATSALLGPGLNGGSVTEVAIIGERSMR